MTGVGGRLKNRGLALDLHEVFSVGMVLFVVLLYAFGLDGAGIRGGLQHLVDSFGLVERGVLGLVVLMIAATFFVRKWNMRQKAVPLIRVLLSFFVMLVMFEAVGYFIGARQLQLLDLDLQKIDAWLFFGKQPAEWLVSISFPALTNLLSSAYASWFVLTYGTIFLMLYKGKRALLEYTTSALLTFYIGYLLYMVVPAIGPLFTIHFDTNIGGVTSTVLSRPSVADCFPSLHTGISVVMLVNVWRHSRRLVWLYAPLVTMIIFSTVYLRLHYAIDVIAGIALALTTTKVCPYLLDKWASRGAGVGAMPDTSADQKNA
ncbi:MAG: phosphatase PAP2 family protein [Tumebacillaceae bacterium]